MKRRVTKENKNFERSILNATESKLFLSFSNWLCDHTIGNKNRINSQELFSCFPYKFLATFAKNHHQHLFFFAIIFAAAWLQVDSFREFACSGNLPLLLLNLTLLYYSLLSPFVLQKLGYVFSDKESNLYKNLKSLQNHLKLRALTTLLLIMLLFFGKNRYKVGTAENSTFYKCANIFTYLVIITFLQLTFAIHNFELEFAVGNSNCQKALSTNEFKNRWLCFNQFSIASQFALLVVAFSVGLTARPLSGASYTTATGWSVLFVLAATFVCLLSFPHEEIQIVVGFLLLTVISISHFNDDVAFSIQNGLEQYPLIVFYSIAGTIFNMRSKQKEKLKNDLKKRNFVEADIIAAIIFVTAREFWNLLLSWNMVK